MFKNVFEKNIKRKDKIFFISLFAIFFVIIFISSSRGIGDNEVCEQHLAYKECVNSFTGKTSLIVDAEKYNDNGILKPINTNLVPYGVSGYDYKVTDANYKFYVKSHSNFGDGAKYCVNESGTEYCLTYQSQDYSYRDSNGAQDYISSISDKIGVVNGNSIYYNNVFPNVSLRYTTNNQMLKEEYIITNLSKTPANYLTAPVTLDFGGYIKFPGLYINVDGLNKSGSFTTSNQINFMRNGKTLFYLPKPYAYDTSGHYINLQYEAKVSGPNLWFYVRTPYEWLNSSLRKYPVTIDPSIEVGNSTAVMGGNYEYDYVLIYRNGSITVNNSAEFGWLNITATINITVYGNITGFGRSNNSGGGDAGGNCQPGLAGKGLGKGGGGGVVCLNNAGGGGGGGHYNTGGAGGTGGTAIGGSAGANYSPTIIQRDLNITYDLGSGGGAGGAGSGVPANIFGGPGGAAIRLKAPIIIINGTITTRGQVGADNNGGDTGAGGGGSGGTLILYASNLLNITNATISIIGGLGGVTADVPDNNAGGGGGGASGILKLFYGTFNNDSSSVFHLGSLGGAGDGTGSAGSPGGNGLIYYEQLESLAVSLVSPTNSSSIPATQEFICDANMTTEINANLTNVTFFLWNASNNLLNLPITDFVNGTTNHSNFSFTFAADGDYYWNCLAETDTGFKTFGIGNFTVSSFTTKPAINLQNPLVDEFFNSSLNIIFSATATDSDGFGSCSLYHNVNGVFELNQTNSTLTSGALTVFNSTNVSEGSFIWNVNCSDAVGNMNWAVSNRTFTIDLTKPLVSNITITTTEGSQTFTFRFNSTDINLDSCWYSIVNSTGGIDPATTANISVSCNSIGNSETVSTYGTYSLLIYSNDSANNINSTNKSFIIIPSSSPPPGGGGGGTIIIGNESKWSVTTSTGSTKYEIIKVPSLKRSFSLSFENLGENPRIISMGCVDISGELCNYVSFSNKTFTLPVEKEKKVETSFTISFPESINSNKETFNIVALDDLGQSGTLTVDAIKTNFLLGTLFKLLSTKNIFGLKIYYALIFLFSWIGTGLLFGFVILRGVKNKDILSFFIGLVLSFILIIFI